MRAEEGGKRRRSIFFVARLSSSFFFLSRSSSNCATYVLHNMAPFFSEREGQARAKKFFLFSSTNISDSNLRFYVAIQTQQ